MKTIDLFAGIGGIRIPFDELGCKCVFSSDWDKNAQITYESNFGHKPYGDITAIDSKDIPDHDILLGGFPCFIADTTVLTSEGLKPIQDVKIGELVLTHKQRWKRVLSIMKKDNAPTMIIKGQGSCGIETTSEHPFYVRSRQNKNNGKKHWREFSDAQWKEAENLTTNHFWASPTVFPVLTIPDIEYASLELKNNTTNINKFGEKILDLKIESREFMYFIGRWIGDGWLGTGPRKGRSENNRVANIFLCSSYEEENEVEEILKSINLSFTKVRERTVLKYIIGSKPLTKWLETNFGRYASGKKIPGWVFGMSHELKQSLFDGYMSADGHTSYQKKGNGRVRRLSSINKNLLMSFRLLLSSLEITTSLHETKKSPTYVIEDRIVKHIYSLTAYDDNRSAFFDNNILWGKIRSIMDTDDLKTVYNIEVEEDNSYVADGIIVHNCQPFSAIGSRKGFQSTQGTLFFNIASIIDAKAPRAFLLENVKNFKSHDGGKTYEVVEATLNELGYHVHTKILNALDYGLPQKRERTIIVGFKHKVDFKFPDPLGSPPSLSTILEPEADNDEKLRASDYIIQRRLDRLASQGSAQPFYPSIWHENKSGNISVLPYSVALRADASHNYILVNGVRHPSARELLRLQGFPDTFKIILPLRHIRKQAGNSVPVPMIRAVAKKIMEVL
jgi:DNA (cytosine-5)-methyltransferase 1